MVHRQIRSSRKLEANFSSYPPDHRRILHALPLVTEEYTGTSPVILHLTSRVQVLLYQKLSIFPGKNYMTNPRRVLFLSWEYSSLYFVLDSY